MGNIKGHPHQTWGTHRWELLDASDTNARIGGPSHGNPAIPKPNPKWMFVKPPVLSEESAGMCSHTLFVDVSWDG